MPTEREVSSDKATHKTTSATIASVNNEDPTVTNSDILEKTTDNPAVVRTTVHLDGFADATPSPSWSKIRNIPVDMGRQTAEEPKEAAIVATAESLAITNNDINDNNKTNIDGDALVDPSQDSHDQARQKSLMLNQSALLSSLESNNVALQTERDLLQSKLITATSNLTLVQQELELCRTRLENVETEKREEGKKLNDLERIERNKLEETEKKLLFAEERVDRLMSEGDGLRKEISRLAHSNEQYITFLNQIQSQYSLSASSVIPLKLEVTRLQQEIDAVTSHSNYVESELASRNETLSRIKQSYATEITTLRAKYDHAQSELEKQEYEAQSARRNVESVSLELEKIRNRLQEKEYELVNEREIWQQDLCKERELVLLKEQRMLLAEDQRNSLLKELGGLKALAQEATEEATLQVEEVESRWRAQMKSAIKEVKEEEERKRLELEDRLQLLEENKRKLEDDILSRNIPKKKRKIMDGAKVSDSLAITEGKSDALGDEEPFSLTDLYTRLAETEDNLRMEQHENKRLKILIERIHQDVASKTPIFHQKQLELESALDELEEAKDRLDFARREVSDIRADNQDLEVKNHQMEKECRELRRENVDLALQVQTLLQRGVNRARSGPDKNDNITFDSIQSLHEQNQKLLRDHHSMKEKIQMLEDRIQNNPDKIELNQLKEEIVSLREEREKQSKLVAGIVHQRDLYRALVAKNDATLIESDASNQIITSDLRLEQIPLTESKDNQLADEVGKLRADVLCFKHEKQALENRLERLDAHAEELVLSNEKLRGELTTANAMVARMEIDVSHYSGRCERLESSLDIIKREKESEADRRNRMEELNSKLQTHLDGARSELARKEQQFQSTSSKIKTLEIQLQNAKSAEERIASEANDLRSEISQQGALLTTVQRIEANLIAKSEGERERLEQEVKRLTEVISNDATKYSETLLKLEGKVADLETNLKELSVQKESSASSATKAMLEVSKLNVTIQELTLQIQTKEKELAVAKRKLGDVTIDTTAEEALEAKISTLISELESTKSERDIATKRIADYQQIAKVSEEQVAELTAASSKYKEETELTLERLKLSEKAQKEAVAELTRDLMSHRGEKEKVVSEQKAVIDSLTGQLAIAKADNASVSAQIETLMAEMKAYQLSAEDAQNKYSRELALHAEARSALMDAHSKAQSEQHKREEAEAAIISITTEFDVEKSTWQVDKLKLEMSLQEGKTRLDDLRSQNNLLRDQMHSLSATVLKFHSRKETQLIGEDPVADSPDKEISDLRELLHYKQSECAILEADLASAKRAAERERTAADLAKRSLEEARSELKVNLEKSKEDFSIGANDEKEDLYSRLRSAEEQLVLVRESNTLLREESHRITTRLSQSQAELNELRSTASLHDKALNDLEVEKASLLAERTSLSREIDDWKKRVHSLVSKFNQIDPEEHAQALTTIQKLKSDYSTVQSLKENAERDTASAKALVARLNKDISSQKASIDGLNEAIRKLKSENEKLTKINETIVETQTAAKTSEEALAASHIEITGLKARVENFKNIMQKLKENLTNAMKKEEKSKIYEETLVKEISELKKKLAERSQPGKTATIIEHSVNDIPGINEPNKAYLTQAAAVSSRVEESVESQKLFIAVESASKTPSILDPNNQSDTKVPSYEEPNEAIPKRASKKRKANAPHKGAISAERLLTPQQKKPIVTSNAPPPKADMKAALTQTKETYDNNKALISASSAISQKEPTSAVTGEPTQKVTSEISISNIDSKVTEELEPIEESMTPTLAASQGESAQPINEVTRKVPNKRPPISVTNANEEEDIKLRILLRKRKTVAAKKLHAGKKGVESEVPTITEKSDKPHEESALSLFSKAKLDSCSEESSTKTVTPTNLSAHLPSVPELEETLVVEQNVTVSNDSDKEAHTVSTVDSLDQNTFIVGSSANASTLSEIGLPDIVPQVNEPACTKPSSFGQSTLGSVIKEAMTSSGKDSTDTPTIDLTPPEKSGSSESSIFDQSANITLPLSPSSPSGVFSQGDNLKGVMLTSNQKPSLSSENKEAPNESEHVEGNDEEGEIKEE